MNAQDLKNSILQLAIQGKLVEQREEEGTAKELLEKIEAEKKQLIKEGKTKKQEALPTIKEDEIPFDIPESWDWVKLGQVFDIIMGQSPKGTSVFEGDSGIEFHQGKVFFGEDYLENSNQSTNKPTKIVEPNTVLLCVRAPVGIVNITTRRICMGRGLCGLNTLGGMDSKFLMHFLRAFKHDFIRKATGTTFIAITGEVVKNQIFPLPPLEEQKRIVAKIEELMPYVDKYDVAYSEVEELNKKFPEDMQKSILQYAIQGKLVEQREEDGTAEDLYKQIQEEKKKLIKEGKIKKTKALPEITEDEIAFDIPENWKWVRMGEIGSWSAGATPSRSNPKYYGGEIPWLKTGDLNDGYISEIPEYISEEALNKTSVRLNPVGSVLMAMYGATIGKLGILDIEATTNQACCACIPFKGIYNKFLFYYLLGQRSYYIKMGAGGAQPNISKEKIVNSILPLPPLEEQKRIVEKIEELLPYTKQLVKKVE